VAGEWIQRIYLFTEIVIALLCLHNLKFLRSKKLLFSSFYEYIFCKKFLLTDKILMNKTIELKISLENRAEKIKNLHVM